MSRKGKKQGSQANRNIQARSIPRVGSSELELVRRALQELAQDAIAEPEATSETALQSRRAVTATFGKAHDNQTATESERAPEVVTGGPGLPTAEVEKILEHRLTTFKYWVALGAIAALLVVLAPALAWLMNRSDTRTEEAKNALHQEITELRGEIQRGNDQIRAQLERLDDRLRASEARSKP